MIPAVAALAAGQAAAGLAGTLLNKKKQAKIDYAAINAEIARAEQEQRDLIASRKAKMQGLLGDYKPQMEKSIQDYVAQKNALGEKYLQDVVTADEALGSSLSDTLKRKTLAALPEQQRNLKEQLAAQGGLARGSSLRVLAKPVIQAASSIAEGQTQIAQQQLQNRINALEKLRQMDDETITTATGYTRQDLTNLLSLNRADITDEVNGLLDVVNASSTRKVNAMVGQATQQQAINDAAYQRRADIINAISGGMGSMAGAFTTPSAPKAPTSGVNWSAGSLPQSLSAAPYNPTGSDYARYLGR